MSGQELFFNGRKECYTSLCYAFLLTFNYLVLMSCWTRYIWPRNAGVDGASRIYKDKQQCTAHWNEIFTSVQSFFISTVKSFNVYK